MVDFGRVLTAMVTPFDATGNVDYENVKVLANYLADNGTEGIVVAGTTGESPTLTVEEKITLFKVVKEAVGHRVKVIAGTGTNNTRSTIELTKAAQDCDVDGIMLVAPYYNKPSQEGLYQHFAAVAKETSLPIMLYNIPGRSSINMAPALTARLAKIDNFVAIKEAAGNLDQVAEMRRILPPEFIIYSGDDSLTLPMLAVGSHGIVSVAAHLVGAEIQKMIKDFLEGNVLSAQATHLKLFPLFKSLFITSNPVPVKLALNMKGIQVGDVRLPLVSATEEEQAIVRNTMFDLGIL